ncbi:class I SAM-dependent methyltransferase [Patescibacteria group bacterium]
MADWDKIYQDFEQGGEAWATLSEDIDPIFSEFTKKTTFPKKSALDIGCGTGKYMKFLEMQGFTVAGIDSSPTAVKMTRELLGKNAKVEVADMFTYRIPKDRFDFIFSFATIHHGTKDKVKKLLEHIYEALLPGGKIFITVPDLDTALKNWDTFEGQKEISPGTYIPLSGPEKDLPHSFYKKDEVKKLFTKYKNFKIVLDDIGRWMITGTK